MTSKWYTGIGSRETPDDVLEVMTKAGKALAQKGWGLRSGGATGADQAFESGWWLHRQQQDICYTANDYECYVPWWGYEGHERTSHDGKNFNPETWPTYFTAMVIAALLHPNWDACKRGAKAMHARNCYQVLGPDLATPSKFVIGYAKTDRKGIPQGGTATAFKLAKTSGIEVFNLYIPEHLDRLKTFIGE
jgi:hypothetical protein